MNIYREKLLNAVLYFAKNTRHVNLTKISKLLYYFDFDHFKMTGFPSIGLDYYSFDRGPVPRDFWLEIKDGEIPEDFIGKLALIQKTDDFNLNYKEIEIRAITEADLSVFTPREIGLLEKSAYIYKEARGKDMTEVSHLPEQPWAITVSSSGKNKIIDYILAIDDKSEISSDDAIESLKEHFDVVRNFNLKPTK